MWDAIRRETRRAIKPGVVGNQDGFGGLSGGVWGAIRRGGISRDLGGNQQGSQEGCGGKIGGDEENRKTQDF